MIIKKRDRYILSILSGLLLVISFPFTGSITALAFFAWVPLLLVENTVLGKNWKSGKVFVHAYISFLIYNIGTTWWIYYASPGGAYLAFILNSFLMALAFYFYHLFKRNISRNLGLLFLLISWIGFEHLHYHWELSWPWLTLGNIFSTQPFLVQWYEYTGVMGGSIWILLINYFIFHIILILKEKREFYKIQLLKNSILCVILLIIPIGISLVINTTYIEELRPVEVAVIQPNIDPYNEKFVTDAESQIESMLHLTDSVKTSNTKFVLFPETAISSSFDESQLNQTPCVKLLMDYLDKNPAIHFLIGASTYKFFQKKNSIASKKIPNSSEYIEFYNSSLALDSVISDVVHKSKLVLGVEKIPFSEILPFLEELSINNGGTSGTLGQEKEPKRVNSMNGSYAPVVCYESIYGEFVTRQVQKGADLIFIITNDGWWKNTPGHKQHNSFASLRAIETRRSIARSANTGISSFINQKGEIVKNTDWWKEDAIKINLNRNSKQTIYSRFGDIIYRFTSFFAILLSIVSLIMPFYRILKIKKELPR